MAGVDVSSKRVGSEMGRDGCVSLAPQFMNNGTGFGHGKIVLVTDGVNNEETGRRRRFFEEAIDERDQLTGSVASCNGRQKSCEESWFEQWPGPQRPPDRNRLGTVGAVSW
jgi:hypothetical protein